MFDSESARPLSDAFMLYGGSLSGRRDPTGICKIGFFQHFVFSDKPDDFSSAENAAYRLLSDTHNLVLRPSGLSAPEGSFH